MTNTGSQNINGQWVDAANVGTDFSLSPGQTEQMMTTRRFVDFSIVSPSSIAPQHAASVRCWNQTSGGDTRAQCFMTRSDDS